MEALLSFAQVIIAVVLIFLVLMHSGKDSGLSGAFGVGSGAGPLGGGSMVERNLNRWTVFFAILFVGNTILLLKKPWASRIFWIGPPNGVPYGSLMGFPAVGAVMRSLRNPIPHKTD